MLTPRNFTDSKPVYTNALTQVCMAVDEADGTRVLLKQFAATEAGWHAFEVESESLAAFAGGGVPRVLDRVTHVDGPGLLLQCPRGLPLSQLGDDRRLALDFCLDVAAQLAAVLGRVHASRAVHLGLRPEAIFVDPETARTQLVDFSRVLRPADRTDSEAIGEPTASEPSVLRFASPEQTGRTGRNVDSRSDLYSLGACLYFMATGCAPFESDDVLAIVHALIARQPRSVSELRGDTPSVLVRIIDKLLEKAPDARYQTAIALQRDLHRCRTEQASLEASPADFALAAGDGPHRPLFSGELHGREVELGVLEDAWRSAREGAGNVVLVCGAEGMGKSALLAALRPRATEARAFVAEGRCERSRTDSLFWAVARSLESVVQQLLVQREDQIQAWQRRLAEGLGSISGALVGVIPDVELLLPDIEPARALSPRATLARLALALERLVRTLAGPGHPFVFSLDDLQWIDAGSRDLLMELLTQTSLPYVLFVGTYQADASKGSPVEDPFVLGVRQGSLPVTTLSLAPLGREAGARMLAAALGRRADEVAPLADCVARKTANSPLLIRQFVDHCYELGLLRFEDGRGWNWDQASIERSAVGEAALGLLSSQIERLPVASIRVLERAACLGETFEVERFAAIFRDPWDDLERDLTTLHESGLLSPVPEGVRFVHDRIREAALQRLTAERRCEIHETIARWMLEDSEQRTPAIPPLEVADHVNQALERMLATDRGRVIEINASAGAAALAAGVGRTALNYLDVALDAFGIEEFESRSALALQLHLDACEAASQVGDYARALKLLEPLEERTWSPIDVARIGARHIQILTMVGSQVDGVPPLFEVLAVLRRHGIHLVLRPSRWWTRIDAWRTDRILAGPLDERSLRHATSDPSGWLPRALLIAAAGPVVQLESGRCLFRQIARGLREYKHYGYIGTPALLLAAYGNLRRLALGHLRGMERYAEAALRFAERCPDETTRLRARFVVAAFIHAWTRSRREAVAELTLTCAAARELGDLEFALFSASQRANYVALTGTPLPEVERELRSVGERSGRGAAGGFGIMADGCAFLIEHLPDDSALAEKIAEVDAALSSQPASRMSCWAFWQTVLVVLGRYAEVEVFARSIASWCFESGASSCSQLVDYEFTRGLAAAMRRDGEASRLTRAERQALRRVLRQSLRGVRRWASDGKDFRHMATALEGEWALVRDREADALRLLAQASDQAARIGYVHHAALLLERIAQILVSRGRPVEATVQIRRAVGFYEEWGARAKARELLARYAR